MNQPAHRDSVQRFGTFAGVFRPTTLTILGAMLYLREGWLVGNNGLVGAIAVIVGAYAITGTTALSAASIATNHRVRPGGAFAIISQALGLEAGGAIGVPLYVAQALSSAMYLYAFSEAWAYLFPTHDTRVVVGLAFMGVSALAWRSAAMAFRAQGVMQFVVVAALLSLFSGLFTNDLQTPELFATRSQVPFLDSFAIFFPAATGIMVGVGMSGQLESPRRSIPQGTLGAWGFTLVIYLAAAVWYALVATPAELLWNKTIVLERSAVGVVVLIGVATSTLTAALSSLVAAPRLLQAMADNDVVPGAAYLRRLSDAGEPRRAAAVTTAFAALGLLSGSLDAIAPIITAFFLLTYLALNFVVLLEQQLGMISFRPTFDVPTWVPAAGVMICAAGLFLASPRPILFIGILVVVGIYAMLVRRSLDTPWETARSGVTVALAAWAARQAAAMAPSERAWKPDLLVPVTSLEEARQLGPLVRPMVERAGSVKLMGLSDDEQLRDGLRDLVVKLRARGVHATSTVVGGEGYVATVRTAIDAMQGDLFPPNLVLLDVTRCNPDMLVDIHGHCRDLAIGLLLYVPAPDGVVGKGRRVEVWLSDRHPDWELGLHVANLDLPVLLGYLLSTAWGASMRLVTVVGVPDAVEPARSFLTDLAEAGRLPSTTTVEPLTGAFMERLAERRAADVYLFGLGPEVDRDRLLAIRDAAGGACLFLLDSGQESALA